MRYQRIFTQIWNDEKFTGMSPGAQRLFLYLLTCPHSNLIGLYILKNGYIMEDLDLSPQSLKTQMQEIVDHGMISRCSVNFIIFIPNYLKFNPLTNPNQVTSAIGIVESMPKSVIIRDFVLSLEGLSKGLNESLREGLVSVLESVLVLESEDLPENDKPEIIPQAPPALLGEHKNVRITPVQVDNLIEYVGGKDRALDLIERLSIYLKSSGKKYASHYAAMQGWHRKDAPGATAPQGPTMTAEQEGKRKMLKNELAALHDQLEAKKQVPEGHPIYAAAQREIKSINKRIDEIERELEG